MADIQEKLNKNDIFHLNENMGKGFKGVNKRLDTLNGQVAANTNWRYYITGGLAVVIILFIPILLASVREFLAFR